MKTGQSSLSSIFLPQAALFLSTTKPGAWRRVGVVCGMLHLEGLKKKSVNKLKQVERICLLLRLQRSQIILSVPDRLTTNKRALVI